MVRARQVAGGPIAVRNASYASSKEILKHISELGITKVKSDASRMYIFIQIFPEIGEPLLLFQSLHSKSHHYHSASYVGSVLSVP